MTHIRSMKELVGSIIGEYQLKRLLGKGGMGAVFLAWHVHMKLPYALKVLLPELSNNEHYLERFFREARQAAQLKHPNVVSVQTAGKDGGYAYMAMDYVEGSSLKTTLAKAPYKRLGAEVAVELIIQALRGVGAAHKLGMIHRDIKPDNIMLSTKGEVKVADFGLARHIEDVSLTKSGQVLGTPAFMSYEQWECQDLDPRTDIYSMGATLFNLVTGRYPYEGKGSSAIVLKMVSGQITPLREVLPTNDDSLESIILKMLERKREERYSTAEETTEALSEWKSHLSHYDPVNAITTLMSDTDLEDGVIHVGSGEPTTHSAGSSGRRQPPSSSSISLGDVQRVAVGMRIAEDDDHLTLSRVEDAILHESERVQDAPKSETLLELIGSPNQPDFPSPKPEPEGRSSIPWVLSIVLGVIVSTIIILAIMLGQEEGEGSIDARDTDSSTMSEEGVVIGNEDNQPGNILENENTQPSNEPAENPKDDQECRQLQSWIELSNTEHPTATPPPQFTEARVEGTQASETHWTEVLATLRAWIRHSEIEENALRRWSQEASEAEEGLASFDFQESSDIRPAMVRLQRSLQSASRLLSNIESARHSVALQIEVAEDHLAYIRVSMRLQDVDPLGNWARVLAIKQEYSGQHSDDLAMICQEMDSAAFQRARAEGLDSLEAYLNPALGRLHLRNAELILRYWNRPADPSKVPSILSPYGRNEQGFYLYERKNSDWGVVIYVPPGYIEVHSDDDGRTVLVEHSGFFLDKYEVSIDSYQYYCRQVGLPVFNANVPDNQLDYPVTGITWAQARAYARWVGGVLPTEIQWVAAAYGTDGRSYPWGNFEQPPGIQLEDDCFLPVRENSGDVSPYGHMAMGGNAREWLADPFTNDWVFGLTDNLLSSPDPVPDSQGSGNARAVRGGSYMTSEGLAALTHRQSHLTDDSAPDIGYRVCITPVR